MTTRPPQPIDRFTGEHRWLSNFFMREVIDDAGNRYASVEHAYQAAKARTEEERRHIADAPSAKKAKRRGGRIATDEAWSARKVDVMRAILLNKFAPGTELAAKLLATGEAHLAEGNAWGDRFWGVCDGEGENHMGRLLMEIRTMLRAAPSQHGSG